MISKPTSNHALVVQGWISRNAADGSLLLATGTTRLARISTSRRSHFMNLKSRSEHSHLYCSLLARGLGPHANALRATSGLGNATLRRSMKDQGRDHRRHAYEWKGKGRSLRGGKTSGVPRLGTAAGRSTSHVDGARLKIACVSLRMEKAINPCSAASSTSRLRPTDRTDRLRSPRHPTKSSPDASLPSRRISP
jgi:hypothetical protein